MTRRTLRRKSAGKAPVRGPDEIRRQMELLVDEIGGVFSLPPFAPELTVSHTETGWNRPLCIDKPLRPDRAAWLEQWRKWNDGEL